MMRNVYVKASALISPQNPLCDDWMENPLPLAYGAVNSFRDPEWKRFVSPLEGRRMSAAMKRALAVSTVCLEQSGIKVPDAIICGTGLGLQENTEAFLEAMCLGERTSLRPVHFMQSTHNTIASMMAIRTGAHGYNATYSHGGISFESALSDAWTMVGTGKAGNVLAGAFDEITPFSFACMEDKEGPASGTAAAFMLSADGEDAACRLAAVRILYRPSEEKIIRVLSAMLGESGLEAGDIDLVLADSPDCAGALPESLRKLQRGGYSHIFGSNCSASAAGMHAAVACFRHGHVPEVLACGHVGTLRNILIYNRYGKNSIAFVLLAAVPGTDLP